MGRVKDFVIEEDIRTSIIEEELVNPISRDVDTVEIFTFPDVGLKNTSDYDWYFRIYGSQHFPPGDEVIWKTENKGSYSFCYCNDCKSTKADSSEIVAALKALSAPEIGVWEKEEITLRTKSELLALAYSDPDEYFKRIKKSKGCMINALGRVFGGRVKDYGVKVYKY